jgi:hypothetical protein
MFYIKKISVWVGTIGRGDGLLESVLYTVGIFLNYFEKIWNFKDTFFGYIQGTL